MKWSALRQDLVANFTGGDTAAWLGSLTAHLTVLVLLALAWRVWPVEEPALVLSSFATLPEEAIEPIEAAYNPEPAEQVGSDGIEGSTGTLASSPQFTSIDRLETAGIEAVDTPEAGLPVTVEINTAARADADITIRGNGGIGTSGTAGAVDRITQEILLSLEQRPTLVVWMFDHTGSIQLQRKEIDRRFDRIYHELGLIEASGAETFAHHKDAPLLTSIVTFGREVSFRTPQPTAELDEIHAALQNVDTDESGVENVFSAIEEVVKRYDRYRTESPRRNVMLVVITDEAGEDQARVESTLAICLRNEMPVYVIGVPAVFGRQESVVKYVDPDPKFDQSVQWIPVRQGPESGMLERVQVGFAGLGRESDLEFLDSGFGPFALTRLCLETGGIYFAVHPSRSMGQRVRADQTPTYASRISFFFDSDRMRDYAPDYVTQRTYQELLTENKARAALVEASRLSAVEPMQDPRLFFPVVNEAELKRLLDVAQRDAAIVEPRLAQIYQALEKGEKDRDKLTGRRWQAGYDLAMGRVLAVTVRTVGYNAMLATAKNGMRFTNPDSDTWLLAPAPEIAGGTVLEEQAASARKYLERVRSDHPGTPWALLAEQELSQPMGWHWTERRTGVNQPQRPQQPNPNFRPPQDSLRKIDKPPPPRRGVKL